MNKKFVALTTIAILSITACTAADDTEPVAQTQTQTQTQTSSPTPTPTPEPPSDKDNDGVPDDQDFRPKNPDIQTEEQWDKDGDGVPNTKDAFPNNAKFSSDKDGDRVPDSKDYAPENPDVQKQRDVDADLDGVLDVDDYYPNDPSQWEYVEPEPVVVAEPEPASVYYDNCTAARDAGGAPVYRGDPGYGSHLDRDGDGVGCE